MKVGLNDIANVVSCKEIGDNDTQKSDAICESSCGIGIFVALADADDDSKEDNCDFEDETLTTDCVNVCTKQ